MNHNIDYKNKYNKYKIKYLKLNNQLLNNQLLNNQLLNNQLFKNIQYGGTKSELKILDLNDKHDFQQNDLQNNLHKIEETHGNKFIIKYKLGTKEFEIPVIFEQRELPNDIKFYQMTYDIAHRTTSLYPFKIDFYDYVRATLNNNSYIANMQKTDKISGTDMLKICLKINEIIGVKKTNLIDATSVMCKKEEIDLSFVKLLEYDKTFYTKLGFEFEITDNLDPLIKFNDKQKLMDEIDRIIKVVRKIKITDIIDEYEKTLSLITKIIKENNKDNVDIMIDNWSTYKNIEEIYKENPFDDIKDIFNECVDVLKLLHKYQSENELLYLLLIKLFKEKCDEYALLYKYIIDNRRTKIIYGDKKIERYYVSDIQMILTYRESYLFSYEFY